MADLTREQMEQVIQSGGSIIHAGRHISTLSDLPNEEQLAAGNPEAEAAAAENLRQQIADLQARLDAVNKQADDEGDSTPVPYEEMNRAELKATARARGIEFPANIPSDALIQRLHESDPQGSTTTTVTTTNES